MLFWRGYLSLRWRLLIPLTLSLAAGIAVLSWMNDTALRRQADDGRAGNLRRDAALLGFLVRQNQRHLVDAGGNLAELLAASGWTPRAGKGQSIPLPDWERLRLDYVSLGLYDHLGQAVGGFGEAPALPDFQKLVRRIQVSDKPVSGLHCERDCLFYALLPVLANGRTVGAVVLASDLSSLLSGFGQSTRRDLALAVDSAAGTRVLAATAPDLRQLPALRFRNAASPEVLVAGDPATRRSHEWQRLPLPGQGASAALLTRLDVSAAIAAQNQAFYNNLLTALVLFAGGEGALLVALGWLRRRMQRVGAGLPLLGEGRWQEAQRQLTLDSRSPRDEFGELERATLALASQLGNLDAANRRQQNDLEHLIDTLSGERDFVNRLLDTAQALILTQTTDGVLRMVNHQVETLVGRSRQQLVGRDYFEFLIAPGDRSGCRVRLHDFVTQAGTTFRVESPLEGADGSRHNIAWAHTLIGGEAGTEPLILSIGLDLTELKRAQAKASYLADFDPLTGLWNRNAFQRGLQQTLKDGGGGALLVLDLDNFKALNDLVGAVAGDEMIRRVADHLRNLHPEPRLLGRTGGDDFGLFFSPMPEVELLQTARVLCQGDSAREITSACVGLAQAPAGFDNAEELLARADLALSQARAKGRASWHLYNAEDGAREGLVARNERHAQLADALRENRLKLALQPVVAIQSGRVSHYEALLRVLLPDGRILSPAPFIAAAEETGFIREIDEWVLHASLDVIARSQSTLKLAVNLSARSLDRQLPDKIAEALLRHDVPSRQVTFEITETAALDKFDEAGDLLSRIRELGCKLALDDFGVGFSTFQYLKHLPVDYVKIDGSFIRNLDQSEDDQVFVRALVQAAHGYGKLVIAEFVESDAILSRIRDLDVDFAQGYLFSRPIMAEDVLNSVPAAAY